MLEYQYIKTFLLNDILEIGLEKKVKKLKKLKILFHGPMLFMISMAKKFFENFMKKNCKKKATKI